ncbi:uncharacterized protein LOC121870007 isoform X2 [Homarus americanus]|uniref:WW domain-containing oxidoreductase-like 2 n=1 Tax=Homarus americanus TaxID=6706 RepID=A0A8J5K2Z3_HOMAM|nr:uncharacterized protein LOC121870007 isoform X2 [Homarus americanus]KAG7166015.1 WW domain-containing oxidoreductase-like 2 [Homarus americanus]
MAGRWDGFQGLPHGWEVKFDGRSGRYYFVDHINKQTSWEDPRLKSAPPPPPHPDTLPAEMRAQQESQSLPHYQNVTNAPLQGGSGSKYGGTSTTDAGTGHGIPSVHQEAGLLEAVEHSQLAAAKISAMFPTVPESHIKDLMKKYHNREAVVISALQVQKHPLATPGPYGTFTPPPMRHFIPTATALMALQSTKTSSSAVTSTTSTSGITTSTTTATSQDKSITQIISTSSPMTTIATSNGIAVTTTDTDQVVVTSPKIDRVPYRSVYERVRGIHLDEKARRSPMIGQHGSLEKAVGSPHLGRGSIDKSVGSPRLRQGSLERSIGSPYLGRDSPLLSSRASSPHAFLEGSPRPTARSTSDFTRSLIGSPRMDYRHSPRPSPHSPKIKLRYLKGIFPKVDPTVILDVLTQCNYNVKDASEKMILMGHEKKDTILVPPKLKDRPDGKENKAAPKPSPGPPRPKNLSEKHKKKVRNELTVDYPAITPTVVTMALQSVFYDEARARQVLNNMAESDRKTQETLAASTPKMSRCSESKPVTLSLIGSPPLSRRDGVKPTRPSLPRTRINTAWTAAQTVSRGTSTEEDLGFRSEQRTHPSGPNTKLHKGPSECLLLSDYQVWHGPNPENATGHSKALAQGPKRTLLRGPSGLARGQDPTIRKGPQGLAKGSKFIQGIKKEPCFSTKML